jgi:hypothetical protein
MLSKNYPVNVTWTTPGKNSSGSMPLGNGDITLNAWVEAGGDLLFFIGKSDSWDENSRLLKLGRLRLRFSGNPFAARRPFRQSLHTGRGEIEIVAGKPGKELRVRLWVDANNPVVRVEAESDIPLTLETRLEVWRTEARELPVLEDHAPLGKLSEGELTKITPDTIAEADDALVWFHRNERSIWGGTLRLQGLEKLIPKLKDPLLGLTSGGLVRGTNLEVADRTTLRSTKPGKHFSVSVHPLVAQTPSAAKWTADLRKQADATDRIAPAKARSAHLAWWKAFWERSHIVVGGSKEAGAVTLGYNLERFLQAGASRGKFPMKFNGSLYTVDGTREQIKFWHPNVPDVFDADFRMWGGGYWFQNCRLIYWPMLLSGDFDLMKPFFRLYQDALAITEARTRIYFGHGGAYFSETMAFWGSSINENYGYDRSGKTLSGADRISAVRNETKRGPFEPWEAQNTYIRRYWQGGIELVTMMLDYHSLTQDKKFLDETLLPVAHQILTFFREHWPKRDSNGKIHFEPAKSLETWHVATNPTPEIAGLKWVTQGLLNIPGQSAKDRKFWTELQNLLPPLPTRIEYGKKKYILPAEQFDVLENMENPELYAVFPYRLFGVGKPDLEVGRETYKRRIFTSPICWSQQPIQSALLGLTEEAKRDVVFKFTNKHPGIRFPAFWCAQYDWIPDHDNGGVAMTALQLMLLQSDGDRILLLPAWPRDWDVSFKLHAPKKTTVECVFQSGKIKSLKVSPASRRKDVELIGG